MHDMDLKQMSVYQKAPSIGEQSDYEGTFFSRIVFFARYMLSDSWLQNYLVSKL